MHVVPTAAWSLAGSATSAWPISTNESGFWTLFCPAAMNPQPETAASATAALAAASRRGIRVTWADATPTGCGHGTLGSRAAIVAYDQAFSWARSADSRRPRRPASQPPVRTRWRRVDMSTLRDLVEEHTTLGAAEVEHLHRLAGDWQLIADLSFADLLLWVAVDAAGRPADGRSSSASPRSARPPAPTAYQDDQVGRIVARSGGRRTWRSPHAQGRIWREGDPVWYGDTPARHEAIPVRRRDGVDVIARGRPGHQPVHRADRRASSR